VTSMDRNPARRRKKIYLDYMQNRRGQTLAAPYCVRPRRGAPVSMPLTWRELKQGLKPGDFNLRNALSRMQKGSDPWSKILGPPVDLTKCAKLLQKKYFKD
jgi:bifunctional non-homologous end joining protein LigD